MVSPLRCTSTELLWVDQLRQERSTKTNPKPAFNVKGAVPGPVCTFVQPFQEPPLRVPLGAAWKTCFHKWTCCLSQL